LAELTIESGLAFAQVLAIDENGEKLADDHKWRQATAFLRRMKRTMLAYRRHTVVLAWHEWVRSESFGNRRSAKRSVGEFAG